MGLTQAFFFQLYPIIEPRAGKGLHSAPRGALSNLEPLTSYLEPGTYVP